MPRGRYQTVEEKKRALEIYEAIKELDRMAKERADKAKPNYVPRLCIRSGCHTRVMLGQATCSAHIPQECNFHKGHYLDAVTGQCNYNSSWPDPEGMVFD